jgi:ElaB/YqjD/DUF883 family membrane-anchored ribosome-binding protein
MNQNNDQTVAHQAADVVDNLADGVRSAAHTVGEGVRSAAQTVRSAAGRAATAVEETYDEAGRFARDSVNHSLARARSVEDSFESCVRENPKSSLLVAAAIGAILGAWWTRR